jgi:hypothetical protein
MAAEIRSFTILTPTGIAKATPLITSMSMPVRIVREIEIRVPPGPNGELGFAIGMAGQNVIPYNAGEWFVTSDEVVSWTFDTGLDSGAWQCQTYNTGSYPHTIQVRFYLDLVPDPGAVSGVALISPDALSSP